MKTDIAVLGGGASGLAAAIAAKEANMAADVTVIEKLPLAMVEFVAADDVRLDLDASFHRVIGVEVFLSAEKRFEQSGVANDPVFHGFRGSV